MSFSKAEMELHHAEYGRVLAHARGLLAVGSYKAAVDAALASCQFIDGMMRYERKYSGAEFDRIEGIDIVLYYAPLLFDVPSLDGLRDLLKARKQIDKNAAADLAADLSEASARIDVAYRIWTALADNKSSTLNGLAANLGLDLRAVLPVLEGWGAMGVVDHVKHGEDVLFSLVTDLDEAVAARCAGCGAHVKAAKNRLLYDTACPKCKAVGSFTILFDPTTKLVEA